MAGIDVQESYRMHHLNCNGSVGIRQEFCKSHNGDLIPKESELVEVTPNIETPLIRSLLTNIRDAIIAKQKKSYVNTNLVVYIGQNYIYKDNEYPKNRIKETILSVHNKKFDNIFVVDHELSECLELTN